MSFEFEIVFTFTTRKLLLKCSQWPSTCLKVVWNSFRMDKTFSCLYFSHVIWSYVVLPTHFKMAYSAICEDDLRIVWRRLSLNNTKYTHLCCEVAWLQYLHAYRLYRRSGYKRCLFVRWILFKDFNFRISDLIFDFIYRWFYGCI